MKTYFLIVTFIIEIFISIIVIYLNMHFHSLNVYLKYLNIFLYLNMYSLAEIHIFTVEISFGHQIPVTEMLLVYNIEVYTNFSGFRNLIVV